VPHSDSSVAVLLHRELVLARASEQAMLPVARKNDLSSLREQCLARVREGLTTLEEVVRVTQ
jgi:type II secretory ATPase GspE/PulE/Tfp pilus assembly ATPase PilB-like protein